MLRLLPLGLILCSLVACSDDEVDPKPWVDAMSEEIQSEDSIKLPPAAADCVASAAVEAIGADELETADVTPSELAAAESLDDLDLDVDAAAVEESLAADLAGCELGAPFAEVLSAQEGFPLSSDTQSCFATALDEDPAFAEALAASFVVGDEGSRAGIEGSVSDAIVACPKIVTDLFIGGIEQEIGTPLSAEAIACVEAAMEARPVADLEQIVAGGAPAEQIGQEIGIACQESILAGQ